MQGERHQNKNEDDPSGDAYGSRSESPSDSVFKRAFKFYKKRSPPPDLSDVFDLRKSDAAKGIVCSPLRASEIPDQGLLTSLGFRSLDKWRLTTIAHREGLYILSDIFEPSCYLKWINRSLKIYPEPPNKTNIHIHVPDAHNIFENYANKLRWTTLGRHYNWTTKLYPQEGAALPEELTAVADLISRVLGLGGMSADATIVNYYPPKSTLSPHVDRSERLLSRPLISLSFGQSAVYLTGGTDLDDPVDAIFLHSGDVLVMHADQRLVYHAVPRIVKTQTFAPSSGVSKEIVDYANLNRVNITIRQVDPH